MTAWDTTALINVQSSPIDAGADFFQQGLFIGKNGTKLYHTDGNGTYEYDLTTPWDINTLTFNQSAPFTARDIWFRDDGLTMFALSAGSVTELSLSTAWDITTASITGGFANLPQDDSHNDVFFRADGLQMFTVGSGNSTEGASDRIYKYKMTTPWDLSTLTFNTFDGDFHTTENFPTGIFFRDDGLKMFVLGAEDNALFTNSSIWEYNLLIAWDVLSVSGVIQTDLSSTDSTPLGLFFHPSGQRMYHGGRQNDEIFEWTMTADGLEHDLTVNAILVKEFITTEVSANIRNRDIEEFSVGARLVWFCDNIDSATGWITTNGGGQLLVDDISFPDVVHFELMKGGGGATERWTRKDIGRTVSGDIKMEFKFDFQAMETPTGITASEFRIFLQEDLAHPDTTTGSKIGCELGLTRRFTHTLHGVVDDGVTSITSIQGGANNQKTTHVYAPNNSGGVDAELLGPYWITVELKDSKFRMSLFKDENRTIHARGSPREVDATGINPTNLRYLTISNGKGAHAVNSTLTGDIDTIYVTQNEPLPPLAINPTTQTVVEDWENLTVGDENPSPWNSFTQQTTLNGGTADPPSILIREVSDEEPNGGIKSFKLHSKYQHTGGTSVASSSDSAISVTDKALLTPPNPDGGDLLIPYKFTAQARGDIMSPRLWQGVGNVSVNGGVYVRYTLTIGAPFVTASTESFVLVYPMFSGANTTSGNAKVWSGTSFIGGNSVFGLPPSEPLGQYSQLERNLKADFESNFLPDANGWDFESHVKQIDIGYFVFSNAVGQLSGNVETLLFGDEINLLPEFVNQHEFTVNAIIKALGDNGTCISPNSFSWTGNRQGSNINDDHQFSHFELRPLHSPSSTPLILGERITHIRVTRGSGGTSKFTLAIYEGGAPNPTLKAVTAETDFTGVATNFGVLDVPLLNDYFIGTTNHDDIWVCIAVKPEVQPGHNRANPAQSWRADSINFTREKITYSSFDVTNTNDYPDFPSPTFDAPAGIDFQATETSFFELIGPDSDKQQKCIAVDSQLVLEPGMVQITTDVGMKLKAQNLEHEFTVNAIIVLFSEEAVFSQVHLQGITAMFSEEAPLIGIQEFTVSGKAVLRQAQNGTQVTATLIAFDQKQEFFVNAVLQKTDIQEFTVKALLEGDGQTDTEVHAILKALDQEVTVEVDAFVGEIKIVESRIDAFIKALGVSGGVARVDAFIKSIGGVSGVPETFEVDAQLVIPLPTADKEFTVSAVIGLSEPQSILDVESVIGHKTGLQT